EIDHFGSDHPKVEHVGSCLCRTANHSVRHGRSRQAHVAPNRNPSRLELLNVRAPNRVSAGLVELVGINPADVVGLEHLRTQSAADARGKRRAGGPPSSMKSLTAPGSCT